MFKSLLAAIACAVAMLSGNAMAQGKELKIGVIYDLTGPFADSGSYGAYLGAKYAIDIINERGGVEGYKIKPIYADAQSKVEVAINEAERLLNQEKVDVILGLYSSSQCVPLSQKVEQAKKILWAGTCTSAAVFKDRGLKYTFRVMTDSDQFGPASCGLLNSVSKSKLGKDPKDLKVALIYEDGPYGVGSTAGLESACKGYGMQVVLKEGYSASTPDLSSLVTKLKRAGADVILHTGQSQDVFLFLRQAKSQNLKWSALIGHGGAYGQIDKLYATFKDDVDYIFDTEPVGAQILDQSKMAAGLPDLVKEITKRYKADVKNNNVVSPTLSMGFNSAWVFFNDVVPRAIKKYGGVDPEALRKAAMDTDIPDGGTIQGTGVKFYPAGHRMEGQNERATMPIVQYEKGESHLVWPVSIRTKEPVVPVPKGTAYAP